ncbi:Protein SCO1 like, mitochondrial, partial [Schistosoma japonicum]
KWLYALFYSNTHFGILDIILLKASVWRLFRQHSRYDCFDSLLEIPKCVKVNLVSKNATKTSSKVSPRSSLPIRNMSIFNSEDKIRYLQWGVFIGLTGVVAGSAVYMTRDLKKAKEVSKQSFGRPSIGGDFNLIDHNGKPCTLADFRGKWVLLYFGFCRCPDICPEQLERLVEVSDRIMLIEKPKYPLVPVFMTVDSERDTPEVLSQYIKGNKNVLSSTLYCLIVVLSSSSSNLRQLFTDGYQKS